ncbi:hypothetical protein P8935_22255 [Telmatobacter sp. DSM 110680]|uniref:Uncharacterized protein n=1 Tax=Telmatobacter sp. DSM 110680 TaxID=3036704 RepID=A0AAU7DIR0_9BACT
MTPDPYRNAYQKALEDLTVISETFEQLSNRKKHVENLVLALQPIFSSAQSDAPTSSSIVEMHAPQTSHEMSLETPEPTAETEHRFSFLNVPAPLPESDGDPFERRVKANFRFRGLSAQRSF